MTTVYYGATIIEELFEYVQDLFSGVQVVSHEKFSLNKNHTIYRSRPDGGQDVVVTVSSAVFAMTAGSLDLVVRDTEGNNIQDTRTERVRRKREFAELVAKHRSSDSFANAILQSYRAAVPDPKNELVHLFEIEEILTKRFGNDKDARTALGISRRKWDRLRILANVKPLLEGRHRGKHPGILRKASSNEREDARTIAQEIIYSYLVYLDNQDTSKT